MKKLLLVSALGLTLAASAAFSEHVRDWRDLDKVRAHVHEAIGEMARARAANHYDMDGHGAKAEELLKQAEAELHAAIESSKHAK